MTAELLESESDLWSNPSSTNSAPLAPQLVITENQVAQYLVMEMVQSSSTSFWSDALALAQRAARV
jgi:hypothetical protein